MDWNQAHNCAHKPYLGRSVRIDRMFRSSQVMLEMSSACLKNLSNNIFSKFHAGNQLKTFQISFRVHFLHQTFPKYFDLNF